LLAADDPLAAVRRLLAAREPWYARAPLHVETAGRAVDEVAREIETAVRARGILSG
jgi:shikimate kinase